MNSATLATAVLLGVLASGSLIYCLLSVLAAHHYVRVRPPALRSSPPMSLLRPLHGKDENTEENLRSCFAQNYPNFEILVATHDPNDAAVSVFETVRAEFPEGPKARLVVTGRPILPNAKAHSLDQLVREAKHSLLMMSDADVRLAPDTLSVLAAEFQDPSVGVITCPYRAVPGRSVWSRLEAIGINTEFFGGVFVARMLEGVKFALGPAIAARREVIESVGGFEELGEFLAEDFVFGQRAAEQGYRVTLSSSVVEHRIGNQRFRENLRHRLRWARSTRRSRPVGYWGQAFTNPLSVVFLLWAANHRMWPLLVLTVALRGLAAREISGRVLSSSMSLASWLLLPVQDLLSFLLWLAAFFGNEIHWGGRKLVLRADGRLEVPEG